MQVSVETTTGLERRMTVEIPKEKLETEVQSRLKSLASKAKIAGFRPGKVPLNVIKRKYGPSVHQEVMGEIVQSSYIEALQQENLQPAGMPSIEHKSAESDSSNIAFTATFEIYPEISIADLNELNIEKPVAEISGQDIDEMLETIRKQQVNWTVVERSAQIGDKVTMDFEGKIDGEVFDGGTGKDLSVELGTNRMIPGFEDQLVGINASEHRELSLKFPDSYHAVEMAGKPVVFQVTASKVEAPELPEINDEFALKMGVKEGGMDALRNQIQTNMQREVETKIKSVVKQEVMDKLLERNKFEIPNIMIDKDVSQLRQQQQEQLGKDAEVDAAVLENQARRRVALGLILSEIIKQNDIKVEPGKLRQIVESIAAGYETPEEVVKYYYSDKQRLAEIENLALEEQVVDWVLENATLSEKSTTFSELMNPGN